MKLPFLYEHLQKSSIDNKEQILEALVTHNWKITAINSFSSVNYGDPVINLESDKGYWLSNIPLDLFSKVVLTEELITINKTTIIKIKYDYFYEKQRKNNKERD